MNTIIITSDINRASTVKSKFRQRLYKSLSGESVEACFCRVKNQFGIYGVELVVQLQNDAVIETGGRHFYVHKAFEQALSTMGKKINQTETTSEGYFNEKTA